MASCQNHSFRTIQRLSAQLLREGLGNRLFETVAKLQAVVERYFCQRVAKAKQRRDQAWAKALAVAA